MTPEDKRELQVKIVELLHAAGSFGLPAERIKRLLLRNAYGVDDETLALQLKYLKGEGLVDSVADDLRPEIVRWISTSKGDQLLMREGLSKV